MDNEQMNLFDLAPEQTEIAKSGSLHVVHAEFVQDESVNWKELFEGYDELYGITFSSGIQFMEKAMDQFGYVEMIFGCEGVLSDDVAAIMSMETKSVEQIAKCKSAKKIAERIDQGSMALYVSRDTKSHEKVFVLKSKDGRTRVITGSANMSASAFCGLQREDIVCFDDGKAFEHYYRRFIDFREQCSDRVSEKAIFSLLENEDHIIDNIEEVPILKSIEKHGVIILEQSKDENTDVEILADIKGLEKEMKPMIPKPKKDEGKLILSNEVTRGIARKYKEHANEKKRKEKKLPKLHVNYETRTISFNGKEWDMNPAEDNIKSDIKCFESYMSSLSTFYGDWKQSQKDYYAFMNWYFASLFMPYLRYVASKNNHELILFPVFGIIYGDSNGGKSTFIRLLSKMMCGIKVPLNSSSDFTSTNIENLKRACEGLPINIDDLAKNQYDAHYEKVIKDDGWGIEEGFTNYPAVTISTNKVASLKPDIAKRAVTCFIGTRLDKEVGAKNSRRVNESMRKATNAMYIEYSRRMFEVIEKMVEEMKSENENYFPDILEQSSKVLKSIFDEYMGEVPDYVTDLTYSDYFGEKVVGKNAMKKIIRAWELDRKMFSVNKKKNTLSYTYSDSSSLYELRYIQQELPPILNASVVGSSIVMDLDKAKEVFGIEFRRGMF